MDALTLLYRARAAGLRIRADGHRLIVRGPRTAAALAREILDAKDVIMPMVRAWTEAAADRLLREEIASLGRMAPPAWASTVTEREEIQSAEMAIDTAFRSQDTTALHRALRDYRWAIFRSWRRHNAAGRPITEDLL